MVENEIKKTLLRLLRRGQISIPEAARYAFVSRQAVEKWVAKSGFDPEEKRAAYVQRLIETTVRPDRQASSSELRQEADAAEREWQQRQAKQA